MQALSVVGPPDARATLADELTGRFAERGTVGRVTQGRQNTDATATRDMNASQAYTLDDEGWVASGDDLSLTEILDRLAQTCEYAVIEGYPEARVPTIVLGDRTVERGEVIARVEDATGLDHAEILAALEESEPYETLSSLVARVKESPKAERSGAIATFTGRVREKDSPDDDPTELLEFEKYDGVAEEKLATIREELEARDGIFEVLMHHRTGVVEAGEDIVFVVVLAGHRPEAFRTVEDGINRLKEEVPLFKKEVTIEGEFWAHQHEH